MPRVSVGIARVLPRVTMVGANRPTFDSFEVIDDQELVVYKSGSVLGCSDGPGRQTY